MVSSRTSKHPIVQIVLATAFEEAVDRYLSEQERRALYLLLAEDPTCGVSTPGLPGLLKVKFARSVTYYVIGEDLQSVYLLTIESESDDLPPPSSEEISALSRILRVLAKGSAILVAKRGLSWLLERIGELMS